MALDGVTLASIAWELKSKLLGGRIVKISQPEKDELMLTVKSDDQYTLLISADASLPLVYLARTKKQAPLSAPNFCMLLRKHLNSARIVSVSQPGLERIIDIEIEHLDELGDLKRKHLIIEIMGKHSNIILVDEAEKIVDSIKRVSAFVSSKREVLPGREYFVVRTEDKHDPTQTTPEEFESGITAAPYPVGKAVMNLYTGISPLLANEIAYRAGIDADTPVSALSPDQLGRLYGVFARLMEDVREGRFSCEAVYEGDRPKEFASVKLTCMSAEGFVKKSYDSPSLMLEEYYSDREKTTRIRQKSADLRKAVNSAFERAVKKLELQRKELDATKNRDKYREYGELLSAYGYGIAQGEKSFTCESFRTGEQIVIPLDETMSAIDNAKRYFERYSKQKRTFEMTEKMIETSKKEVEHLDSIKTSLDLAVSEEDLETIREELVDCGYVKRHLKDIKGKKKVKGAGKPYHFLSSDGFHIYVGRNNYQNDELTFKLAKGEDMWFHAKGIPGSHVVLVTEGKELPDRAYEEAAALAGYFSKNREADKVEIDYLEKKNVKKPAGAKPGFVVYYTNYSMVAKPAKDGLEEL